VLGIGMPGTRLEVIGKPDQMILEDICKATSHRDIKILTLHMLSSAEEGKKDIVVHVDTEDVSNIIEELKDKGYEIVLRKR